MKVTVLAENTALSDAYGAEHGLSLFIESGTTKLLFDMGRGELFLQNAEKLGVSIAGVDVAVLSHGHYDHGGGLKAFLAANEKAPVYVNEYAFEAHFSQKNDGNPHDIGLDPAILTSGRIHLAGRREEIRAGMTLFSGVTERTLFSRCNDTLLMERAGALEPDDFRHEQNLLVWEGETLVLFAGCAHCGIVNIVREAERVAGRKLTAVFGGFHLQNPSTGESEPHEHVRAVGEALHASGARYYTGHCTGDEPFAQLKQIMGENLAAITTGGVYEL